MHPRAMEVRTETAQQRIGKAAAALAALYGVEAAALTVERRDPAVQGMERQEAAADVLEAVLSAAQAAQKLPEQPAQQKGKGAK